MGDYTDGAPCKHCGDDICEDCAGCGCDTGCVCDGAAEAAEAGEFETVTEDEESEDED